MIVSWPDLVSPAMRAGGCCHQYTAVQGIVPSNVNREFTKLLRRVVREQYRTAGAPYGDTAQGVNQWIQESPTQQRFLDHRPHDLRHSMATYLLMAGVDGRIVMQMMGWSQIVMLK